MRPAGIHIYAEIPINVMRAQESDALLAHYVTFATIENEIDLDRVVYSIVGSTSLLVSCMLLILLLPLSTTYIYYIYTTIIQRVPETFLSLRDGVQVHKPTGILNRSSESDKGYTCCMFNVNLYKNTSTPILKYYSNTYL